MGKPTFDLLYSERMGALALSFGFGVFGLQGVMEGIRP
jgi:hypothetical protein